MSDESENEDSRTPKKKLARRCELLASEKDKHRAQKYHPDWENLNLFKDWLKRGHLSLLIIKRISHNLSPSSGMKILNPEELQMAEEGATGENVYKILMKYFSDHNILTENMIDMI
ncbi:unnamed protein product [Euphydryas editha]|uniref:Uncharacterized protein n=1 Tax=Euphydryas editha TaxID=104508 RepID=A0AAU9TK13_EUPED|nr:unnamed protein product [Euphydryas editha]